MLSLRSKKKGPPRAPKGYRAYAVGDVHGRLDLLDDILAQIEQDVERRPARRNLLDERDHVARSRRDANLGDQLVHR